MYIWAGDYIYTWGWLVIEYKACAARGSERHHNYIYPLVRPLEPEGRGIGPI